MSWPYWQRREQRRVTRTRPLSAPQPRVTSAGTHAFLPTVQPHFLTLLTPGLRREKIFST